LVNPREHLLAQPCGYGALAQLGERRLCKPEVTGSIPVRSTSISRAFFGRLLSGPTSAPRMAHTRGFQIEVEVERGLTRRTRIEVAVALQDEARVTMPQLLCDDVRRSACRDHQRRVRMPKVMEREPNQFGASNCRPEDTSHEVVLAPHSA
jgi:hypothetical protein